MASDCFRVADGSIEGLGRMKVFDLKVWKVFNDFGYTCSVAGSGW